MRNLIIIRGVAGAGKTTFAELMANYPEHTPMFNHKIFNNYPVFAADDYFMKDGVYNWDPKNLGQAHEQCFKRTEKEMQLNTLRIFVANTFTTERELKPYFELAEKYNYKTFSIIVENRHESKSIHDVPEETLEKQKRRFSIKL